MSFRIGEGRVVVRAEEIEEKTDSGLFVPDSGQSPMQFGTLTHVGPRRNSDGYEIEPDFEPGDRVFFSRHSGQPPLTLEGVEYRVMGYGEIFGVLDPETEDDPPGAA